jgi:hypothetical protein
MAKNDLIFDGHIAIWDMGSIQGEINGTYTGTFKFRSYLSPTQQLAASREYRELLGPNAQLATDHDGHLAYALVQLKHRVISAPPFWNQPLQDGEMAGSIPDLNVILITLDAAIRAENQFKKNMKKERDKVLKKAIKTAEDILVKESEEESEEK